jgi:hypothetical protein
MAFPRFVRDVSGSIGTDRQGLQEPAGWWLVTLLAPEIVEAILDGRQEPEKTLPVLMRAFPVELGVEQNSKRHECP